MSCNCNKDKSDTPEPKPYGILDVIKDTVQGDVQYTDEDTQQKRLLVCSTCEKLLNITQQCTMCGCFVQLKVKYVKSSCPMEKW